MDSASPFLPCPRCGLPTRPDRVGGLCPRCVSRTAFRRSGPVGTTDESSSSPPVVATLRFGPYELGEELGRGAMGVVYRAHDSQLKREVALKLILAGQFASGAERKRFLAEAELAARLEHPHIVPIFQSGETDGRPWFAMKLIAGTTLAAAMQKPDRKPKNAPDGAPRLSFRHFAALISEVARAVQHAHERGVLHRDLKPGNILLDAAGEPHVTDFGLARRLDVEGSLTLTGSPLGTPAYMAPELARGDRVTTTAADVWSLGAILYELVNGRPPFAAENVPAMLRRILEDEPARRAPATARDLEVIALRCLRKDPRERYPSAGELADDLDRWSRGEPIQARPAGPAERLWRWARRRPLVAALGALLILGTAAGTAALARANRHLSQALVATRQVEGQARTNFHRALLAQIRARRGVNEVVSPVETLRLLAEIARTTPTADTRNEAVLALAVRDVERAAATNPTSASELVLRQFAPPARPIRQGCMVDTSPDGRLVLVGSFDGLHLWDFAMGREIWSLEQAGLPWMTAAFSPDGKWLLCSARNFGIQRRSLTPVTDPESGRLAVQVGPPERIGRAFDSTIQSVHNSDRNWLVALDRDPLYIVRVELWPDGDPVRARVVAAGERMTWVTISPDLRWTVSTTFPPKDARLWDAATGKSLGMLGATDAISAGFSPDSRHLLTRTQTGYTVWDLASRQAIHRWTTPQSGLAGRIRFSTDGRWLALLQGNDRIVIHRAADWQEALALTLPRPTDLYDCIWSRDDRHLILMSLNGQLAVWNFDLLCRELAAIHLGVAEPPLPAKAEIPTP